MGGRRCLTGGWGTTCHSLRAVEYRRTYRSGYSRYDEQRDPIDHQVDKVLPEEPGPVHAVPVPRSDRGLRGPHFLDSRSYKTAVCGAVVKVELSQAFDPGDEDSCPKCVGPAMRGEPGLAYRDRREQEPPADRLSELVDELETQRASAERED
jgi:hypothetical protein